MKAPEFWNAAPGLTSTLLSPLAAIWTAVTRRRMAKTGVDVGIPVICVGNLTAGGTGKTPVVMALLERLSGKDVHVVTRGYGGAAQGPLRVIEAKHSHAEVGDEPLLLSAFGPVWVAKDRVAGAMAAKAAGARIIILDDGFQNPSLLKTKSILVVDAELGFGNGKVIPAGPLREPIAEGLSRADLIIAIGSERHRQRFLDTHHLTLPVLEAELKPLQTGMDWTGLRVLAFAGIGRPEKFFNTLKAAGADLIGTRSFGDHAPYRSDLLNRLLAEARSKSAQLVTTEKDAVRLPKDIRAQVLTFPVRLEIKDDALLEEIVLGGLGPVDIPHTPPVSVQNPSVQGIFAQERWPLFKRK